MATNIKSGDTISANTVLTNLVGIPLKNWVQSIYNAEYAGWESKLGYSKEDASGSDPTFLNLMIDIFPTDDADVSNMVYDSTNDVYYCPDINGAALEYVDVYATSCDESALNAIGSPYNVFVVKLATGLWRVYGNSADSETSINSIFYTLFSNQTEDSYDSPLHFTTMTSMRISYSTFRGLNVKGVHIDAQTIADSRPHIAQNDITFSAGGTHYYVGDRGATKNDASCTSKLGHGAGPSYYHNITGVNQSWNCIEATTIHNTTDTAGIMYGSNNVYAAASGNYVKCTFVYPSGETCTCVKTTTTGTSFQYVSDEMTFSATAPDTASYPLATSYCITNMQTAIATVTNAILTANTDAHSGTTITYSMSANNGTNYESVTQNQVHRFTNTGTQMLGKIQFVRTDLSEKDCLSESAILYNLGAGSA